MSCLLLSISLFTEPKSVFSFPGSSSRPRTCTMHEPLSHTHIQLYHIIFMFIGGFLFVSSCHISHFRLAFEFRGRILFIRWTVPKFYWCHLNKFAFGRIYNFRYRYIGTLKTYPKRHTNHPKRINIIIDTFYQQNLIYFMILMPKWRTFFLFIPYTFLPFYVTVIGRDTNVKCLIVWTNGKRPSRIDAGWRAELIFVPL